ncbi:hypothetical protein BSF44_27060 [Pseudomonas sp. ACN8]|uniref:hypothetical protein n=1 Tax=Pseudomonas sp. ACN8 TaxID=1920428 RepID=UPI0011431C55|nr:hypothetical protein [Pseudomonas sp. ACN8]PBJ23094.1 hypothetical protein BSF44_27060 [Pseudomonas sp. ACN8]
MGVNKTVSYNKGAATFLVLLYCLSTVLTPVFLLNKLIFAPLFLLSIGFLFFRPAITYAPLLIVLIFIYGYFLGFLSGADDSLGRQMLFGSVALFLIYFINNFKVDMSRAVKFTGAIFALVMCGLSFLLMVLPSLPIGRILLDYYNANELGFYGVRNFGGLQMFMLHHRSTPFLLVPLSLFFIDFLNLKKIGALFFVIVVSTAIVCSASRALMVMALVSLSVLYFSHKNWSMRLLMIIVAVPLVAFALYFLASETSMFSSNEQSNSIKIGHLISFFGIIDWDMLLFGKGLGAYFFTEGYGAVVSQTEITWMDAIRFFGLPLSALLLLVLLFPVRNISLDSVSASSRLIMILYLIMSMSNPVLFNSFGFLVVLWYWSIVLRGQDAPLVKENTNGE